MSTNTTTKHRTRNLTSSIPIGIPVDEDVLSNRKEGQGFYSETKLAQATTTIRTATVFFFVGFIWHSAILPFFYKQIGPEIASWIALSGSHVDAFRDPQNLDPKILREFGVAGAASHTIIFMFGFVCATSLRTVQFSSIVKTDTGKWEPIGIGVSLVLVVWTAAVFHVLAQAFCRYAFEQKFGPIYTYATIFYEETNGKTPFAWASSVSFTSALLLGFLISTDFHMSRFERFVMYPFHFMGGSFAVLVPFAIWLGLLDSVLIPFAHRFFSKPFLEMGLVEEDVVNGSHAFAFAVGLLMLFATRARNVFQKGKCCPENVLVEQEQQLEEESETNKRRNDVLDFSNFLHIFQATCMTLLLSTTLLGSVLFKGEVAVEVVFKTLWKPIALAFVFGVLWIAVLKSKQNLSDFVDFAIDETKPIRRAFFTYSLLIFLWNVHMFPFLGCWLPFQLFAYVANPSDYGQWEAFMDGTIHTFTGPYFGPVLGQGFLKFMTTRLKVNWTLVQESLLAIMILAFPSLGIWIRWKLGNPALPVHFAMFGLELLYLYTWRSRPEYSGWRDWPELKSTRFWILIQDYFNVRIIVDGIVDSESTEFKPPTGREHAIEGFQPKHPRIIGFHPHGLFPCTVVWMHLIPLWGKVFGKLIPYQLTDAFTHVPPGMREVMQWSGGREITKGVMNSMLKRGDTLIIVPGGQSELLLHTYENSRAKVFALCAKHRGFIRIAMENRADLVPVFSFAELNAIKNVELPRIQKFSRKLIGIPVPFIPVGVKGMFPIPKKTKMTIVFGKPITTFSQAPKDKEFTEDDVDLVYQAYFNEVKRIYDKYHVQAGYEGWKLNLIGFE